MDRFSTHGSWRRYRAGLEGPHGAVRRRRADGGDGAHAFISVCGWRASRFPSGRIGPFQPKERVLGTPGRVLPEGPIGEALGHGETVGHRVGEMVSGPPVRATLQAEAEGTPWPAGRCQVSGQRVAGAGCAGLGLCPGGEQMLVKCESV